MKVIDKIVTDNVNELSSASKLSMGEAFKQSILDSSTDAIIIVNSSGVIIEFNQGAERKFGYKKEEVIGKMMDEHIIPLRFREDHLKGFRNYPRHGTGSKRHARMQFQAMKSDGREFPVEVTMRPIHFEGEIYFTGFIRDMTEQVEYERALRISEQRYRDFYNETPVMMHTVDGNGNILSVNNYWHQQFGYSEEEVRGMGIADLYGPDRLESYKVNLKELNTEGQIRDKQVSLLKKNGTLMHVLVSSNMDKEVNGIFHTVLRDITKQVEAEKQLVEKAHLERLNLDLQRANRELREFAHVVSHDLKSPLRGIGMLTEWLQNDYRDRFDEEGIKNMELLVGRVRWMEKLIEDILYYSKVGQRDSLKRIIDLNEVLDECIQVIDKPANCTIKIENKLPSFRCFKSNWQQIFQNLIGNGIEHNDKEEVLISIGAEDKGDHYLFWVKDNGPGIEPKHQERVFQIFQTLNEERTLDRSGIGLSIVKKVVELTNGRIWFESEIGEGTAFFFTYPVNHEDC